MSKEIAYKSDNPVLNNPYEEPKFYYRTDPVNGYLDYTTVVEGRRPFGYATNINPRPLNGQATLDLGLEPEDPNAKFINGIRDEVKKWRDSGYPKASRVTRELLDFWFRNPSRPRNMSLFFCQREAVETAIWLNEIATKDANIGNYYLGELSKRDHSVSNDDAYVLPRTAFKMATGTGKTVVMAMLILYNYLNKKANPMDTAYADHFLICTPGITIRDRLGVLYLDSSKRSYDFDRSDYYHQRYLIPPQFEKELGGLNACITIVNFQQFLPRVFAGKHASPLDGKVVYKDGKPTVKEDKESYSVMLSRVLEKGVKGKRMLVINDEAHHCYLPKADKTKLTDDDDDASKENESAMVWYEGLRQMKLLGYKLQHVYDLSATPYYIKGSGHAETGLFPWVVTDFGLVDAIESGLVKIPYLPSYDSTAKKSELDEPKLRNIYNYIKTELPKRAPKKPKKAEGTGATEGLEIQSARPHLPTLLNVALEQFVKDYESYDAGRRERFENQVDLTTAPPVMIIVCNNTMVSKEVFRDIAGYQDGTTADGDPIYRPGRFPVFSNYDEMGRPKAKLPSLLIDSASLDEASDTIDETFKKVYAKEIAEFKKEYSILHGAGSADRITDSDILREVVNTVGKTGKLGAEIRCVVSVSMLTEGWDANTVTHVCGVRAFTTQLLCEQVVGRALRRQSYYLSPYDKDGNPIPEDKVKQYKNITWKFAPEYARIIGVPFNTFKGGAAPNTGPAKPTTIIRSLRDRQELEMIIPNITGYRSDNIRGTLTADFSSQPKFILDFLSIPKETALQTPVNGKTEFLATDIDEIRDKQVVYYFSHLMIREYFTDKEKGQQFQYFPDIERIVSGWYATQLEIRGGDGSPNQKRLVMLWDYKKVLRDIWSGIRKANDGFERITGVLNYYNPEIRTAYVFHPTTKPVIETKKSHVNYVVGEKDSSMAEAVRVLEANEGVICYVRNQFLGFGIPYAAGEAVGSYPPTFVLTVCGKSGGVVNLIVELQQWDGDKKGNADVKREAAFDFWIPAANNLGKYGKWDLLEVNDISEFETVLNDKISQL